MAQPHMGVGPFGENRRSLGVTEGGVTARGEITESALSARVRSRRLQRMRSTGGFSRGGRKAGQVYTPLLGSFSLFFLVVFSMCFWMFFGIFLGPSWELIGVTFGLNSSMKNCIDFLLDFW